MRMTILTGVTAAIAFCSSADAEVPKVAVDISPVHSLVAQVMGDLGAPDLILPPGASPHGYSLRPSEARALAGSDIVFWIGEPLTPWLADPLTTLAGNADRIELLEAPGVNALAFRETALFGGTDGHDEHDDHDDHDDHEEQGDHHDGEEHDPHHEDGHEEDHHDDEHDGHSHEGVDPHAWLDPENAIVWINLIAGTLSEADPENADTYTANADAAVADLEALMADLSERLEPIHDISYVVFHDAYQYFEQHFGLKAVGAISLGDATNPGAARVSEVRNLIREHDVTCIAAEPQFDPGLIETVAGGSEIRTTVLDPMGAELEPGTGFYEELIRGLGDSLISCQ